MTPITYRNQTIERLEAENKMLQHRNEVLENIVGLFYDSPTVLYACGMDSEEYEVWRGIAKSMKEKVDKWAQEQTAQANALEPGEG